MKKLLLLLLLLILLYFLGPKPKYSALNLDFPSLSTPLNELDNYLEKKEMKVEFLKPGNESQIIWANQDSISKTEYAFVYLHGFSASHAEGDPVHYDLAKRYGANMYLARLAGHGLNTVESFADLEPGDLWESAKEALAIGEKIGEKVILISCSTGSTLGIYLDAQFPDKVAGHLMFSPNIALENKNSDLLTKPWGLQLARLLFKGNYRDVPIPENCAPYWTMRYRLEGVIAMKTLVDWTMTDATFKKVKHPYYCAYYYESEEKRDKTISISAIKDFHSKTATPKLQKKIESLPSTEAHVMVSKLQSKDTNTPTQKSINFLENVLNLKPVI